MSTGAGSLISSSNSVLSVNQNSASKKGHQSSDNISIPEPSSKYSKGLPQFRLSFQDSSLSMIQFQRNHKMNRLVHPPRKQ